MDNMPHSMIEIYRMILVKKFKPSVVTRGHETILVLANPNGLYTTNYLMSDGRFKWMNGVNVHRILK